MLYLQKEPSWNEFEAAVHTFLNLRMRIQETGQPSLYLIEQSEYRLRAVWRGCSKDSWRVSIPCSGEAIRRGEIALGPDASLAGWGSGAFCVATLACFSGWSSFSDGHTFRILIPLPHQMSLQDFQGFHAPTQLFFFYVDDIVFAFKKNQGDAASSNSRHFELLYAAAHGLHKSG